MEWIKTLLNKFEDFLKRAFLPSMVFYFFIILFGVIYYDNVIITKLKSIIEDKNFIWIFISFSIGLSYVLNMLHQIIFDNNIKSNFETKCFWIWENEILENLREKVISKLIEEQTYVRDLELNDYILYQIILQSEKIDTKRYIDDSKSYGIVFLSSFFAAFIVALKIYTFLSYFILSISVFILFILFEVITNKYRARAIRIYIAYLK